MDFKIHKRKAYQIRRKTNDYRYSAIAHITIRNITILPFYKSYCMKYINRPVDRLIFMKFFFEIVRKQKDKLPFL